MTDLQINIDQISDIIRQVSKDIILPKFKNLSEDDIREKNPGDFVTIADEMSEKALSKALMEVLPNALVVGEEDVAKDKSVLERLNGDAPVWVIDPIDGTYNFKSGRSHFGVIVSLVQNNQITYGWGYDVLGDRMLTTARGQGTYLTEKGQSTKITFKALPPMSEMTGYIGGAQPWHFDKLNECVKDLANTRCALHDFFYLLTGAAHFVFHKGTTPWDHAALVLMVEEAGGYTGFLDMDTPYAPTDKFGKCQLLAMSSKEGWDAMADVMRPLNL